MSALVKTRHAVSKPKPRAPVKPGCFTEPFVGVPNLTGYARPARSDLPAPSSRVSDLTEQQLDQIFTADPDGWREVEWKHYEALLNLGIPSPALLDGGFTFRIVRRRGKDFAIFEL